MENEMSNTQNNNIGDGNKTITVVPDLSMTNPNHTKDATMNQINANIPTPKKP